MIPKLQDWIQLAVFLISYVVVGGNVVLRAVKEISRGQVFTEHFLMSVATIGAFCVGQYPEGVAVMLFYMLGELLEDMQILRLAINWKKYRLKK